MNSSKITYWTLITALFFSYPISAMEFSTPNTQINIPTCVHCHSTDFAENQLWQCGNCTAIFHRDCIIEWFTFIRERNNAVLLCMYCNKEPKDLENLGFTQSAAAPYVQQELEDGVIDFDRVSAFLREIHDDPDLRLQALDALFEFILWRYPQGTKEQAFHQLETISNTKYWNRTIYDKTPAGTMHYLLSRYAWTTGSLTFQPYKLLFQLILKHVFSSLPATIFESDLRFTLACYVGIIVLFLFERFRAQRTVLWEGHFIFNQLVFFGAAMFAALIPILLEGERRQRSHIPLIP